MTFSSKEEMVLHTMFSLHWGQREEERRSHTKRIMLGHSFGVSEKFPLGYILIRSQVLMFWVWKITICPVSLAEIFYAVSCSLKLDSLLWLFVILVNLYFANNKPMVFLTVWPWSFPPFDPVESSKLMKSLGNFSVFWHSVDPAIFLGFSAKP